MKEQKNNQKLELYLRIHDKTNGLSILTGSLALILLKEIDERICNDIDIVLPYYIDLSEFGKITRIENEYTTPTIEIKNDLCPIHVIIDPKCIYSVIDGHKISNSIDISVAKFKSYMFFGGDKNINDIKQMLKIDNKPKPSEDFNDLPI
jgi:hypothetical protein